MKPRPTIFLSGVSHEFGSFRDAVKLELEKKDCHVYNQPSFATDYRTIEAMLRQKLSEADAVIHIVGFRYGAEPHDRPADKTRRSYTQMEFDIARQMEKPVYVFLSDNASIRDVAKADEKAEDAELTALQLSHRDAVRETDHLYYVFKEKDELCRLAAAIPTIAAVDFRADISRIDKYAPAELIGREDQLALLDDAWLKVRRAETQRSHVLTFVALGGEGKTSLVAKWAAELAHEGWPGCDAAFAWSFYSQGTREQFAASSDLFLKEAITFFGDATDKEFAASSAGAYEKGQRLARVVGQRHNLLILDGLEPLQYAPTSPTAGELKDHGITALLKGLAANSKGLCIVTTRYSVPNLKAFWQTTAPEVKLLRLSREAGVNLLKLFGVKGSSLRNISFNNGKELINEFEKLVEDVNGHALTLNLLGAYLRDAHAGDIRRRDLVKLEEADSEEQSGHAFRVMEAYRQAFEDEGEKGQRALAILCLLGLFDRPAPANCVTKLLENPQIKGLTESLTELNDAQRNLTLKRLEEARLLTVDRNPSGALTFLDAHPLLREYFARSLRKERPGAWREAHRRIFEHLTSVTEDKLKPTLEDLQPLYQAVAHACHAGLYLEGSEVFLQRILREQNYSTNELDASASDLAAIACFFETPWSRVSPALPKEGEAWFLNAAAIRLRSLGRITEAIEPVRAGMDINVKAADWRRSGSSASNLSDMELLLGKVADAVRSAELSIVYADRTDNNFQKVAYRTGHGYALDIAGRFIEAELAFREAEVMQAEKYPKLPLLHTLQGVRYCNLLLADAERGAWRRMLNSNASSPHFERVVSQSQYGEVLQSVYQRATQTRAWTEQFSGAPLLLIALDNVTLSRVALYGTLLSIAGLQPTNNPQLATIIEDTVRSLRQTGQQPYLPLGILARAWLRFLRGARIGPDSAHEDLEEVWEIAERGPMRLHMADIHLYRARLFFREEKYPWESPRADLEAAERLINECGYHRRDEELADAKRAILGI